MTSNLDSLDELYIKLRLFMRSQKFDAALELVEWHIRQNPNQPRLYMAQAMVYQRQGNFVAAIKSLTKVLELEPNHGDASLTLCLIFAELGQYDEASEIFTRARPHCKSRQANAKKAIAEFHRKTAAAYAAAGIMYPAIQEYKKALDLDPSLDECGFALAELYANLGQKDKRIDELNRVLENDPSNPDSLCQLGIAYCQEEKYATAKTCFAKAQAIDASHHISRVYLRFCDSFPN